MIEFNNHNHAQPNLKLRIPTVFIPLNGQIINPNGAPDWQGILFMSALFVNFEH